MSTVPPVPANGVPIIGQTRPKPSQVIDQKSQALYRQALQRDPLDRGALKVKAMFTAILQFFDMQDDGLRQLVQSFDVRFAAADRERAALTKRVQELEAQLQQGNPLSVEALNAESARVRAEAEEPCGCCADSAGGVDSSQCGLHRGYPPEMTDKGTPGNPVL